MSDRPTIEQLDEVRDHFGLPTSALVEKDWFVVKALAAIAAIDTGDLRLVFGGGTALGRAHGLIRRMSEDIDLKIVAEKAPSRFAICVARLSQRSQRLVSNSTLQTKSMSR